MGLLTDPRFDELTRIFGLRRKRSDLPMIAGSAMPEWWEGSHDGVRIAFRPIPGRYELWAGAIDGPSTNVFGRLAPGVPPPPRGSDLSLDDWLEEPGGKLPREFAYAMPPWSLALRRPRPPLDLLRRQIEGLSLAAVTVDIYPLGVHVDFDRKTATAASFRADVPVAVRMVRALEGRAPRLHAAIGKGDVDRVRAELAAGADPNGLGAYDESPLGIAASRGDLRMIEALLEAGADVNAHDGQALRMASLRGEAGSVRLLLDRGADPSPRGPGEMTPLHHAAERGRAEVMRILLERGADREARDRTGKTAGDLAPDLRAGEKTGVATQTQRPARGFLGHMPGWLQAGLGLLATGLSAWVILAVAGVVDKGREWEPGDRPVGLLMGAGFLVLGIALLATFGVQLRRSARRKRLARERPGEPWLSEPAFAGPVIRESWGRDLAIPLILGIATSLLFGAAHVKVWGFTEDAPLWGIAVLCLLTILPLGLFAKAVGRASHLLRHGVAEVRLADFPVRTGSTLRATVRCRLRREEANDLQVTLRAVRSREVLTESGTETSTSIEAEELYGATIRIPTIRTLPGGTREFDVRFPIPADVPPTDLSPRLPTYWELACHAPSEIPTFDVTFLLPVYRVGR